jgi:hypothetical protein
VYHTAGSVTVSNKRAGRYLGKFCVTSPGVFQPQRLVLSSIRCLPTVAVTWLTEMRGVVKSGFTFGGGL